MGDKVTQAETFETDRLLQMIEMFLSEGLIVVIGPDGMAASTVLLRLDSYFHKDDNAALLVVIADDMVEDKHVH